MKPIALPSLAALTLGGALLTGCGAPAAENKEASTGGSEAKTFEVALLTPGPISDSGWNAMAYSGLKAIEKDLSAKVSTQEALDAKIPDAMRSYAQKGASLVIGHGFEYNEPASELAADFPNTVFISSSGGKTGPNFGAIRFYLEQGFYIAGAVAALTSKTGKIAMIGGPEVPSIKSTFKAFEAGAKAAKPEIVVSEVFTGDGQDVAKAQQAALAAIASGADVLIHQANAAAQGVFDAAKQKGVLAIGANLNQNDNASGVVFCSAIIKAEPAFLALAEKVKSGAYKGEISLFGMDQGAIDFVWNESLSAKAPQAAKDKAKDLLAQIKSGTLEVPKDEF
jgi:basic membrane protein A and related proteins